MDWWLGTIVCVMLGVLTGIYWRRFAVVLSAALLCVLIALTMAIAGAWPEAIFAWIGGSLAVGLVLAIRAAVGA